MALALALCAGCVTTQPQSPEEFEAALNRSLPGVVEDPEFSLRSPYDQEATEAYATVLRRELAVVKACFGASPDPVRLYLVPVPESEQPAADEPWQHASRDGIGGMAFASGFALVWVRPAVDAADAWMQAEFGSSMMRHELAHLFAHREGLAGPAWFSEGLAQHVEHLAESAGGLRPHPFPMALVHAQLASVPGELRGLLAWARTDPLSPEERMLRYRQAEALFRFLLERSPPGDFVARARAVHALEAGAVAALEPEWRSWLLAQDPLAAVRAGVASPDARARSAAAGLLPQLAEVGAPQVFSAAADRLALELLRDPATFESASRFLAYFRARSLAAAGLSELCASSDARARVVCAALRARRGEDFDLRGAQAAWDGLAPPARFACRAVALLIPGLTGR